MLNIPIKKAKADGGEGAETKFYASDVNKLVSGVNTTMTDVAEHASKLNVINSSVTNMSNTLSTQADSITSMSNSMTSMSNTVTEQGNALTTMQSNVTSALNDMDIVKNSVTELETVTADVIESNKPHFGSGERGVFGGGHDGSKYRNTIDYVTIATPGNAVDYGDLTVDWGNLAGVSGN